LGGNYRAGNHARNLRQPNVGITGGKECHSIFCRYFQAVGGVMFLQVLFLCGAVGFFGIWTMVGQIMVRNR